MLKYIVGFVLFSGLVFGQLLGQKGELLASDGSWDITHSPTGSVLFQFQPASVYNETLVLQTGLEYSTQFSFVEETFRLWNGQGIRLFPGIHYNFVPATQNRILLLQAQPSPLVCDYLPFAWGHRFFIP